MRVPVSVPVAVWGRAFAEFIPGWWDAVLAMDPMPTQIVIGYENPDMAGLVDSVPDDLPCDVKGIVLEDGGFGDYWNQVFRACDEAWIAPCCIDDRFLPGALARIPDADEAGAELLVDGIVWKYRGGEWRGYWDAAAIGRVLTLPGAAPFKRSLFDRVGGFRADVYSSDWAFYMDAAVAGVRTFQADTLRIVFDEGNAHSTRSGVRLDADTRRAADEQIHALAVELGLR